MKRLAFWFRWWKWFLSPDGNLPMWVYGRVDDESRRIIIQRKFEAWMAREPKR